MFFYIFLYFNQDNIGNIDIFELIIIILYNSNIAC